MSAFTDIRADLLAKLVSEDPSTPFNSNNVLLGRRHLAGHRRGYKIVIVPTSGPFSAEKVRPGGNGRSLVVRQVGVVFFLFAPTLDGADASLHNVVRALRNCFHPSISFGEEEWLSEHEGFTIDGELVSVSTMIDIPVRDVTVPVVTPPLNEAHNTEFEIDGGVDTSTCTS